MNEFLQYAKIKYPDMDVEVIIRIFDEEVSKVTISGPDGEKSVDEHKFPIGSDINKAILMSVVNRYLKEKQEEAS